MDKEKNRFNVEEHTTLDGRIIDVFPISHRYIHNLEQEVKKQKEVIDKIEKYIEKQARMYGLSMSIELGTHLDNILDILKEEK